MSVKAIVHFSILCSLFVIGLPQQAMSQTSKKEMRRAGLAVTGCPKFIADPATGRFMKTNARKVVCLASARKADRALDRVSSVIGAEGAQAVPTPTPDPNKCNFGLQEPFAFSGSGTALSKTFELQFPLSARITYNHQGFSHFGIDLYRHSSQGPQFVDSLLVSQVEVYSGETFMSDTGNFYLRIFAVIDAESNLEARWDIYVDQLD